MVSVTFFLGLYKGAGGMMGGMMAVLSTEFGTEIIPQIGWSQKGYGSA